MAIGHWVGLRRDRGGFPQGSRSHLLAAITSKGIFPSTIHSFQQLLGLPQSQVLLYHSRSYLAFPCLILQPMSFFILSCVTLPSKVLIYLLQALLNLPRPYFSFPGLTLHSYVLLHLLMSYVTFLGTTLLSKVFLYFFRSYFTFQALL